MINISSTLEVNEAAPKIDENISVNDSGNKILRQNAKNMQQHDVYDKSNKVEHKVNDKTSFGELLQYVISKCKKHRDESGRRSFDAKCWIYFPT